MYDTNITYCPPDRLLTEMYKDNRDSEKRKFDRLNELLDFPTVQQIKMKLYKGQGENFICHGEFVNRTDIEWFLKYKEKWNF